tara:strand:+ start:638 stop:1111 length:474 start_codon:yes stop_codon:yes gene_type:complete
MDKKQELRMTQYTDGNILTVLTRLIECMATMVNQSNKVWMKIGLMANWNYQKVGEMMELAQELSNGKIEDMNKIRYNITDLNLLMGFAKEHANGQGRWADIPMSMTLDKAQYSAFRWFTSSDLPRVGWSGHWNGGHPAWLTTSKWSSTIEHFADDDN